MAKTTTDSEQRRWYRTQQFRCTLWGAAAAAGTFAAVAAGWAAAGQVGLWQLGLAFLAAMVAGGLGFQQARPTDKNSQRGEEVGVHRTNVDEPITHENVRRPQSDHLSLCQLPHDVRDFIGRETELAGLESLLRGAEATHDGAIVVVVIVGKGGVGKSTLAIHAAHKMRTIFPDGQLYVNLQGTQEKPLNPNDVLAGFLRDLGMEVSVIPERLEERARSFRARLHGHRVLLLLDNAADEAQVRPLLPGSAGCAVVVTSRLRLTGLEAATLIALDVLVEDSALQLLAAAAGSQRVTADQESASELVRLCGYLPLAVHIAGARLTQKAWPLAKLVERLSDERKRLDELIAGDLGIRASIALGYHGRTTEQQRLFRMLGLLKIADFATWMSGALLDTGISQAETLMEQLVDAHLLEEIGEDVAGQTRYQLHDLLGVFARERLQEDDSYTTRESALKRTLNTFINLAYYAVILVPPMELSRVVKHALSLSTVVDPQVGSLIQRDPTAWLTAERSSLVAAVQQAYEAQLWKLTWQLAVAIAPILDKTARWTEWELIYGLALDATRKACNKPAEAVILHGLGHLRADQQNYKEAIYYLEESLSALRASGNLPIETVVLCSLGDAYRQERNFERAMSLLTRSLTLARECGDRCGEGAALNSLGIAYIDRVGAEILAADCFEQSLLISREVGDHLLEAWVLRNRGRIFSLQERYSDALDEYTQSLEIFKALDIRLGIILVLFRMGESHLSQGSYNEAIARYEEYVKICSELGSRSREGKGLVELGRAFAANGELQRARSAWQRAVQILRSIDAGEAVNAEALLHGLDDEGTQR